jgi:hypothetical protein
MQFLVAVTCTSRKTAPPVASLRARSLSRGDVRDLASDWGERKAAIQERVAAGLLYSGRAFSMGGAAAKRVDADLCVISAGMGLLRVDSAVAPYSLTVTSGDPDCVLDRARRDKGFTASEWWQAIHGVRSDARPFSKLLRRHRSALLIVSLTRPYLEMIAGELSVVAADDLERVRIVGPKTAHGLPTAIRQCLMPYDTRLDDPRLRLRGTGFDFPARALTHFAELLREDSRMSSTTTHARRVRQSLAPYCAPRRIVRRKLNDDELRQVIRKLKALALSRTTALVRVRQSLGFACQAERFRDVWMDEGDERG